MNYVREKLFLIAFIALAGNGIFGYLVYKSNQNRLISEYWVQHTFRVEYEANKLFTTENQIRTDLKAYSLTNDTSFLEPLYSAQKSVLNNIQELIFLTRDNPAQQQRLLSLDVAMQQFLLLSFETAGLKRRSSPIALKVSPESSKIFTSQIRNIIGSIQKEEDRLLQLRIQRNTQDVSHVNLLTLIIFLSMTGFTVLLLVTTYRENREKSIRANELGIANEALCFESDEKVKREEELFLAENELVYQIHEKEDRAAELAAANIELSFQNNEKEKRSDELAVANIELIYQNQEKEDRAAELLMANKELLYQNQEKEYRAAELIVANKELSFQNEEKEKRAAELKKTIALLNKSEVFNRGVLNSLSSHIAVMDRSGKLIAVNESWNQFAVENGDPSLQHTGIGTNYFDACINANANGDVHAGEALQGIRDVLNDLKPFFYMEYPCHSADEQRWFGMRAIKFEGADDLIVVSHVNVTERRQAEQNLLISESSLKEAQGIAHTGNFDMDLVREIDIWSDEMYNILGLNKDHTIPSTETFLRCVHPNDLMMVKQSAEQAFKNLTIPSFEFRIISGDGSIRYACIESQFELDNQYKPNRVFGIFQDITKNKVAELERTKMLNEMITRNKDLEQFAYIVSHNFRAPIANILGASEALRDTDLSAADKLVLKRGIYVSVLKLDQVVKDLNSILEVGTGINEQKELVNFSELVGDVKDIIGDSVDNLDISITSDFSAIGEIFTLKPYLYSIFYNLINNSIKYRQIGIPAIISIKSMKFDDKIELIFTDNGMGIDLQKNGKDVFGMYKRFHENIEGKGMGLFIVKTQVEALHGTINLNSAVNKGSTFSIRFAA